MKHFYVIHPHVHVGPDAAIGEYVVLGLDRVKLQASSFRAGIPFAD